MNIGKKKHSAIISYTLGMPTDRRPRAKRKGDDNLTGSGKRQTIPGSHMSANQCQVGRCANHLGYILLYLDKCPEC